MAVDIAQTGGQAGRRAGSGDLVARLADADGIAAHRHVARLARTGGAVRDLADAIHALCTVHGDVPGLVDAALARAAQPDAVDWLEAVATGMATERAYLATLTAAVGPVPSTPGQAQSEAAILGARHALDMLAASDRAGCATGAVAALVADWTTIRRVMDQAAHRFGASPAPLTLPPAAETATCVAMFGHSAALERAISFGAQQLFAQHRGVFDLLEARADARARADAD